jgi:hypothetical protein
MPSITISLIEAEYQAQGEQIMVDAKAAFTPSTESRAKRGKDLQTNKIAEAARTKRPEATEARKTPEPEPAYIGPASHLDILKERK